MNIAKLSELANYERLQHSLKSIKLNATSVELNAATIVSIIATFVAFVCLYYEYRYAEIKKRFKLQGPRPLPIIGNLWPLMTRSPVFTDTEWREKYGKVYLVFTGLQPRVIVADPEILTLISTKDFEFFRNHWITDSFFDSFTRRYLVALQDAKWKLTRAMFSPTFTSSRIRRMFELLDVSADDLVECIGEEIDKGLKTSKTNDKRVVLQSKKVYSMYTLDAIASCCYAAKLSRAKGDINANAIRNEMVQAVTDTLVIDPVRASALLVLPSFFSNIMYTSNASKRVLEIADRLKAVIEQRRKKSLNFNDYLQILLNARLGDELELDELDEAENHHTGVSIDQLRADQEKLLADVKLTNTKVDLDEEDIIAEAVFMLVSAGETPSVFLRNITYTLAFHQDVQQRLYEELSKIAFIEDGKYRFKYQDLTSCAYLDAVVSEDMRVEAPALFYDRVCNDDYYCEKYDFVIPKGTPVFMSILGIHHNPEYWPEPLKFDPERFMPENRKNIVRGTYVTFGQGPRHCLGVRFNLTECKIALAKCLMNYKFTPMPGTKWPAKAIYNNDLIMFETSNVMIERRVPK